MPTEFAIVDLFAGPGGLAEGFSSLRKDGSRPFQIALSVEKEASATTSIIKSFPGVCRGLPGRPDIVLPKYSAVIEVHGCFWHRHKGCRFCTRPASNAHFWKSKFGETIKRDSRNLAALRKLGWKVAIVWECSVKDEGAEAIAGKVAAWLQTGGSLKEFSSRNAKAGSRRISKRKR